MKTTILLLSLLACFNSFARKPAVDPMITVLGPGGDSPMVDLKETYQFSKPAQWMNSKTAPTLGQQVSSPYFISLLLALLAIPFVVIFVMKQAPVLSTAQETAPQNVHFLKTKPKDDSSDEEKYKKAS